MMRSMVLRRAARIAKGRQADFVIGGNGEYIEHTPKRVVVRKSGALVARLPAAAHRIELIESRPVWTIFVTGPRVRQWGFLCPQGWRHWKEFTNPVDAGATVGRGCE